MSEEQGNGVTIEGVAGAVAWSFGGLVGGSAFYAAADATRGTISLSFTAAGAVIDVGFNVGAVHTIAGRVEASDLPGVVVGSIVGAFTGPIAGLAAGGVTEGIVRGLQATLGADFSDTVVTQQHINGGTTLNQTFTKVGERWDHDTQQRVDIVHVIDSGTNGSNQWSYAVPSWADEKNTLRQQASIVATK